MKGFIRKLEEKQLANPASKDPSEDDKPKPMSRFGKYIKYFSRINVDYLHSNTLTSFGITNEQKCFVEKTLTKFYHVFFYHYFSKIQYQKYIFFFLNNSMRIKNI